MNATQLLLHTKPNRPEPGALATARGSSRARRGRPAEALAAVLLGIVVALAVTLATGCASGTTTTSTGAVRPSAEVQAEDLTADLLKELSDVYRAARVAHDAKAGQEPADVHLARRQTLLAEAAALRASWLALGAVKTATSGGDISEVLRPLLAAAPDFLRLAVDLKLLTQDRADWIRNLLASLPPAPPGTSAKPISVLREFAAEGGAS